MTNPGMTKTEMYQVDEMRVRDEALFQMAVMMRSSWMTLPVLSLVVVVSMWWHTDRFVLIGWFLSAFTVQMLRYREVRKYFFISPKEKLAIRWARNVTWLALIEGIIWGAGYNLFSIPDSVPGQVLLLTLLITIVVGSVPMSTFWPPVLYAFAIPIFGLAAISFVAQGTYISFMMAGMLVLLIPLLYQILQAAHLLTYKAISLNFANIDLAKSLHEQKLIAEQANLAKSKFLAAASHDLRQPIHAQGLFLEVLSKTELSSQQIGLLDSARASSEATSELLDSLLDFSRIEAGVIEPQSRPFLLQPLLSKIENEFTPQAREKQLEYRSRAANMSVQSDPVLLERILRNLVTNAIRYTNRGGLLVACRRHGQRAVIEVWDTGIGIAAEFQGDVFREFHQLGNPERDRRKGLGLGLAIAQGLARTLGHDLTLCSVPQRGSMFRLVLPVAADCLPEHQVIAALSESQLLGIKVLVVDDEESVREGMLHLLRDWGCESEAAESIEEALALASATPPDMVICDYRLREQRTGVEAIVALRALLGNSLPALLITGDTAPQRLREAQASGVPLLHKPVAPEQLYRALVGLLGNAE
jgi:two-component system, sensor histidine kinase